jgi:hypothetical protein
MDAVILQAVFLTQSVFILQVEPVEDFALTEMAATT